MRSKILIRCGVASLLLTGGVGGFLGAGCSSSSSNNGGPTSGDDSGIDGSMQPGDDTTGDSGNVVTSDAGTDADAAIVTPHAKVLFVHAAAPDVGAVRFCFGATNGTGATASTTIFDKPPAPNTAQGLPPGLGGAAADPGVPLGTTAVTFFAIPTATLATLTGDAGTTESCKALLGSVITATTDAGPSGGLSPSQYSNVLTIPAGSLVDGSSWLFALTGDIGNLGVKTWQLDNTTQVPTGSIGAQFVHASAPYEALLEEALGQAFPIAAGFYVPPPSGSVDAGTDAGDAAPTLLADAASDAAADAASDAEVVSVDAGDAGTMTMAPNTINEFIEPGITFGSLAPSSLAIVPNVTFDGKSGFFVVPVTAPLNDGGTAVGVPLALPLPVIQQITPGTTLQNGSGYVFVLLGDKMYTTFTPPAADAGPDAGTTFDPRGLHFLAFPTSPAFGTN